MKIGILTHPLRFNYGGLLQNYALQTVLRRMGHEPLTLDVSHIMKVNKKTFVKDVLKRLYYKYILHLQVYIFKERRYNRLYPTLMRNLQPFIDTHISKVEVDDFNALSENDFDTLIVGSDQVWRRIYMPDIYREYLSFAEGWDVKRISYAASFGTDVWEYSDEETAECKRLVHKFDAVSVREASGVDLCKTHFDIDATWVVDPTLLLEKEDYIKLFEDKELPVHKGSLLVYLLDQRPENDDIVDYLEKTYGLKSFSVNSKYDTPGYHPVEECIQPPVEEWLRGFYDADMVLTDSFHACVFSIIFNKPFIVFGNVKRGLARMQSLLSTYGLSERIIYSVDEAQSIGKDINWSQVIAELQKRKEESMAFLTKWLSN